MEDQQQMQQQAESSKTDAKKPKKHLVKVLVTVIVILMAGTAYLGYLVVNEDESPQQNETTSVQDEEKEMDVAEDNYSVFESEDYGFSFQYPEEWGEVTTEENEGESGTALTGKFSNKFAVEFSAGSTDFAPFGRDGACGVASFLIVSEGATLEGYKREEGESSTVDESLDKPTTFNTLVNTLKETDTMLIQESFESGVPSGLGACSGYFSNAFVIDPTISKAAGITFSLITPLNYAESLSAQTIDTYKANPEFFVDQQLKEVFSDVVTSVKAL